MVDFRYKLLRSWKIDNIDFTQQFFLSIFTDFHYQSIKITWFFMTRFIRLWNSPQRGRFDFQCLCKNLIRIQLIAIKERTIRKLIGVGGGGRGGRSSRKGKLKEKNSFTPINPKKFSCYDLKKIHTRNFITKKNSCGSKIPLPHHNFSNGPSLICYDLCGLCHRCKTSWDERQMLFVSLVMVDTTAVNQKTQGSMHCFSLIFTALIWKHSQFQE